MAKFPRANYDSRRANLTDALTAATARYRDAVFNVEMGTGSQKEADEASAAVAELERRIEALDAAFRRALEVEAEERSASTLQAQADAHAAVLPLLAKRRSAISAIEKAAAAMAKARAEFEEAGQGIITLVRPHAIALGPEQLEHFREEVAPRSDWTARLLAGMLSNAGFKMDGVNFRNAGFEVKERSLSEQTEISNDQIRRRIEPLIAHVDEARPA